MLYDCHNEIIRWEYLTGRKLFYRNRRLHGLNFFFM